MHKMKRVLFISILLLAGCSDQGFEVTNERPLLGIEDQVRESVFRYQFEHNESGQQQSAGIYFLSVMTQNDSTGYWMNGDPGNDLLQHFVDHVPVVKPYSKCTTSVNGVFDRVTGERGLVFYVGALRWVADDQLEVDGGYFEGGLSASGNTYYLQRINGQWTVVKDVMHCIAKVSPQQMPGNSPKASRVNRQNE